MILYNSKRRKPETDKKVSGFLVGAAGESLIFLSGASGTNIRRLDKVARANSYID